VHRRRFIIFTCPSLSFSKSLSDSPHERRALKAVALRSPYAQLLSALIPFMSASHPVCSIIRVPIN
jgi:hypothetical protein